MLDFSGWRSWGTSPAHLALFHCSIIFLSAASEGSFCRCSPGTTFTLANFAWPFFAFLFLYTEETIRVLYGTQWDAAIPLVKILCLAGVLLPSFLFADNLFIAFGRPGITLKIQVISNVAKDAAKPAVQGLVPLIFTIVPTLAANAVMQGQIESIYVHFALLMAAAFVGWIVGLKLSRHTFYNEINSFFGKGRL